MSIWVDDEKGSFIDAGDPSKWLRCTICDLRIPKSNKEMAERHLIDKHFDVLVKERTREKTMIEEECMNCFHLAVRWNKYPCNNCNIMERHNHFKEDELND